MAGETETLGVGRSRLVAWISDDLRAPLDDLSRALAAIESGAVRDRSEVRRMHRWMLSELDHLSALVEDLVAIVEPGLEPLGPSRLADASFDLAYRPAPLPVGCPVVHLVVDDAAGDLPAHRTIDLAQQGVVEATA